MRERSSRERLQIYRRAEQAILDDVALVPLFHTVSVVAARPEVRGLTLTPMGMSLLPLDRVWFATVQLAQETQL